MSAAPDYAVLVRHLRDAVRLGNCGVFGPGVTKTASAIEALAARVASQAAALAAAREALRLAAEHPLNGCATVDTYEHPPCGDCYACKARAALALIEGTT